MKNLLKLSTIFTIFNILVVETVENVKLNICSQITNSETNENKIETEDRKKGLINLNQTFSFYMGASDKILLLCKRLKNGNEYVDHYYVFDSEKIFEDSKGFVYLGEINGFFRLSETTGIIQGKDDQAHFFDL